MNPNKIQPWSETRSENPVQLPEELEDKNVRLLNPLAGPGLYFELYDHSASTVTIKDQKTGQEEQYELVQNVNNPDTSSHFKIIKNAETGHHILLAKGTDLPGKDEGAGRTGAFDDIGDLKWQSNFGCISDQVIDAEKVYLELLQDPNVKSLEVIGYSIGSISANYLASTYGAKAINIADLGVPGTGFLDSQRQWLMGKFDACANGLFPGVHGAFKNNLNENVIGLDLGMDPFAGILGNTGKEYGERIKLDHELFEAGPVTVYANAPIGAMHIPYAYESRSEAKYDAPTTEPTEIDLDKNFKPFDPFN